MLIEKETEHEQEIIELKRVLKSERVKSKEIENNTSQFKHDNSRIQDDILH